MTTTKKPKVLVIVGPTTSHKTRLAIMLANKFNGEIINADAFQVYQGMIIGTNAPTKDELNQAKFHLNQFLEITEEWDIKKFQNLALVKIDGLISQNKLPIIVGGSNLYVDALIRNYELSTPKRDNSFDNQTNEELFNKLNSLNHKVATKIGVTNRKRLIRALQVITSSNDPNKLTKNKSVPYDFFLVQCNYPTRSQLYDSINHKVDEMFKEGWIDEVNSFLKKYSYEQLKSLNAFKAIGYLDILNSIQYHTELNWDKIKQNIRHYAKRQLTWINNKFQINVHYLQDNEPDVINAVNKWLTK